MTQMSDKRPGDCPCGCLRKRLLVLLLFTCFGVSMMAGCGERRSEQYRLEGDAYLKLQKVNEASDAYHKAEAANPNNAPAKVGLGRCYLVQQRHEEALDQFKKAYELDPSLEPAYVDSVNTLIRMNRMDDAIKVAGQYAAASPERGGALYGFTLIRAGRASEAVTLLTGLRDTFPNSEDVRISLATALLAQQQTDKAEQELKAVLDAIDPKSVAARVILSDVYKAEGKTEASIAELRKLSQENPNDPAIKLALARGLAYQGQTDEAQNLAQEVLQQDPGSGWANYVIGSCLMDKRKYGEAQPYLQAAEQALPGQPEVSRRLAAGRAGREGKAPAAQEPPAAAPTAAAADSWQVLWQQAALQTLLRQRDALLAKENQDQNLRETLIVAALVARSFPLVDPIMQGLSESSPLRAALDVMKKGSPDEIMKQFDAWQEKEQTRQVLRDNAFGVALARIGARARAFQVLAKCYQTSPDNAVSLYNIAQVFQEAGMSEFAAKTLQRLIAQYPQNVDAYVLLHAVLRDGDTLQQARSAAEAAYNLFPTSPGVVLSLCQAYVDTKGLDAAKTVLNRALETYPDDAVMKVEQAALQLQSGQPEDAQKTLEPLTVPAQLATRADVIRPARAMGQSVGACRRYRPSHHGLPAAFVSGCRPSEGEQVRRRREDSLHRGTVPALSRQPRPRDRLGGARRFTCGLVRSGTESRRGPQERSRGARRL
ncbi:MAG: tetratricopeptide repeat protein, partial [Chloroflexi bacterium]|nr:tetratricopeptide repeat protein [Chloroflexota bacterium]